MGRKLECDALVDETCKLGLYVTVEPSVDAIHMPDYRHRNFTAHGLRPSISVHTREGKKKPPSGNVAPLLINDQRIVAYQRVIRGAERRIFTETRRKLPAMNIVQTPKIRPYDTPTLYDGAQRDSPKTPEYP